LPNGHHFLICQRGLDPVLLHALFAGAKLDLVSLRPVQEDYLGFRVPIAYDPKRDRPAAAPKEVEEMALQRAALMKAL
jgi:hypothetical protein